MYPVKLKYFVVTYCSQNLQAILCFVDVHFVQYSQHKKETLTDSEHKSETHFLLKPPTFPAVCCSTAAPKLQLKRFACMLQ